MHSRIYGIIRKNNNEYYEAKKEDIQNWSEIELLDQMCGVADYVTKSENFTNDRDWLNDQYGDILVFTGNTTFKINKDNLEKHINDKIDRIKRNVSSITAPMDLIKNRHELMELINNEFDFYVLDEDFCLETLDDYLYNRYAEQDFETEYEIVKTWDYHY